MSFRFLSNRITIKLLLLPGADPGFQVRGAHKLFLGGISCEKSRFYAKKIICFPIAEGGAKMFGVFRVKHHDFTQKNHIFSNFRGGGVPGAPPGSAPDYNMVQLKICHKKRFASKFFFL
jgi:hypothetical protein